MDAIAAFAKHVVRSAHDDLPVETIAATKTFILDSFGGAVAGGVAPWAKELVDTATRWGSGDDARAAGERLIDRSTISRRRDVNDLVER
jgi:aconitate decarboxylase